MIMITKIYDLQPPFYKNYQNQAAILLLHIIILLACLYYFF